MQLDSRDKTEVAKSNAALHEQGRYLSWKEVEDMLRVNMRFNFAIHLPLRWIAALYCLFR
jgi:hypothetical protein